MTRLLRQPGSASGCETIMVPGVATSAVCWSRWTQSFPRTRRRPQTPKVTIAVPQRRGPSAIEASRHRISRLLSAGLPGVSAVAPDLPPRFPEQVLVAALDLLCALYSEPGH